MTATEHPIKPGAVSKAMVAHAIAPRASGRPWTFYALATVFVFYVLALYGPMICIYILSFQDVRGGLVFPMKGFSLHWFVDLFTQVRTGDVKGAFDRSVKLAVIVTAITVVVSFVAGLAFRRRFRGDGIVFYLMIGSLVAPGLVLSIGVGLLMNLIGIEGRWYTSAVGAQLSWTLPFSPHWQIGGAFIIVFLAAVAGWLVYLYCRMTAPAYFRKQTLTRATPTLVPDE